MSAAPVVDARERQAALDPARSFIVQAPAGSGKTGLLIQRYLRLLARVGKPEEILAITFTRKAAAEMRRRVLQALQDAQGDSPPGEANKALTWTLARAALERDRELGWQVLSNPARLRIQTIDALSASLSRQLPVLSRLGAPPEIVENAAELHREAAERTLALVQGSDPIVSQVARVLGHLDGDWTAVRELLKGMLARRDQWMHRAVGFAGDAAAREALEAAFGQERRRILARVGAAIPAPLCEELALLGRFAAENLAAANVESPILSLGTLQQLPECDEAGAGCWIALAHLLLVSSTKATLRKDVNKNTGFPAGKGPQAEFKRRMLEMLERLGEANDLAPALEGVRSMPPARFTEEQWQVLGAMVAILPRAAAELQLVFAERGEIDFSGISQAAVQALGEADDPSDVLLRVDARLSHILVDEFQDTSLGQWQLLGLLTAGWQPGDGRTAFLVGDPMQSIYRFREADVALFLRARREGLPQVALDDLRLATNFRSQAGIVDWVNAGFARILPGREDADEGAVPYSPSSAHHAPEPGEAVSWHAFVGTDPRAARDREATRVAALVGEALAGDARHTVAILVRNRSHLDRIVPALKEAGIRFRAVDIEPLHGRQAIQDLLAITRALSHLADRVAWLGLLRAPWCALTLADLHALTGGQLLAEGARLTVWELMHDAQRMAALSAPGRARLESTRAALAPHVAHRLRGSLRERVESAWLALGGPACVELASDLEDAETFFDQLDELERAGELADPAVLEEHLGELYAAPDVGEEARVQVMTIHKAKGLEFGTVIVPGLDRLPRSADKPLFAWKARADGTLMMAPVRPAGETAEPAFDYLRELDKAAAGHEVERLLYVAATRAETRLHLLGFARLETKGEVPKVKAASSLSLLGKAWEVARPAFEAAIADAVPVSPASQAAVVVHTGLRKLEASRLVVDVALRAPLPPPVAPLSGPIEFSWAGETARHIGKITHRWLQCFAQEGLDQWPAERVEKLAARIERELALAGVPAEERPAARGRIVAALRAAVTETRGRWILGAHPGARCEYRIRVPGPEGVRLLVIDRMFIDRGRQWIVDYKSSPHEGGELERFLDREQERYREQLMRYVPAFGAGGGSLGLYFPLVNGWREWDA